tara:strand:- start:229 stop:564 length:336 start_codon:yes stop_codon:yes gene_type:complete
MAKYKLTAAQKRQVKQQVSVSRSNGASIPRKKKSWSFKPGDLVRLSKKGMRRHGVEGESPWGVVSDMDRDRHGRAVGGGYFRVMTSTGIRDWHGSDMDRVQEMPSETTEDV